MLGLLGAIGLQGCFHDDPCSPPCQGHYRKPHYTKHPTRCGTKHCPPPTTTCTTKHCPPPPTCGTKHCPPPHKPKRDCRKLCHHKPQTPTFGHGYRILLINKCKGAKTIGVRFQYADGRWEHANFWQVPGYSERYLRLDGVWLYTPNPEAYFFVLGGTVGEIGYRYAGHRRWMRRASFDHGEIVVRIPCIVEKGHKKTKSEKGRFRPGL